MLNDKRIGVVVPCYNESLLIGRVIETMPHFVDRIYVVDDLSSDDTAQIVERHTRAQPERVVLIRHAINQGVGGAIASGYKAARDESMDVAAVMAGDAQMDPAELEFIVGPVLRGECDYTKGNRLFSGEAWEMIPRVRYLGNAMLSLLTKIASGYWHVADSQSGYTAIGLHALRTIDWDRMYKRYGQPNDLLVRLNIYEFRVRDIPIRPIYGIGEKSGIRPLRMIPRLALLLNRLFWYRMLQKYVIRDFHPLLFFYIAGIALFPCGLLFGAYLGGLRLFSEPVAPTSALFAALMIMSGLQFLLFAMWMDMEHNKRLR
jgi:glycosyltransferase involved in cell wall biosynthesis